MVDELERPVSRRTILRLAGAGGLGLALPTLGPGGVGLVMPAGAQGTPGVLDGTITIDLPDEPKTLDPALVYDANGWSIVHAVYDALVQYAPDGTLEPLLAESLTATDPLTYEIKLRQGVTFHNGEPFDARSVAVSVAHLADPAVDSQVKSFFDETTIAGIEEIDPHTVRLHLAQPAPWLPAQMAAWLVMLPPGYATDSGSDLAAQPVGTGPFRFVTWQRGQQVELEANEGYALPKGRPIAARAVYRFVPEGSTRVADLLAGTADLVRAVPVDQISAVEEGGAQVAISPVSGSAWVRIATDVAPFSDPRVRQALNHAVDVDAIVAALLGGNGTRLANFFVEGGLGFDPALSAYAYDPDRATALLQEAGYPDGFETTLEYASAEHAAVVEAIAGQLGEVGVRVTVQAVETARFNETWTDVAAAPLRFATWRPLFDPYTLLNLVVAAPDFAKGQGFLSRHTNPAAQALIDAAAIETDPAKRAETYRQLGQVLRDEPAAIYLYGLTARYGLGPDLPAWTPRPDEYIIPTARDQ